MEINLVKAIETIRAGCKTEVLHPALVAFILLSFPEWKGNGGLIHPHSIVDLTEIPCLVNGPTLFPGEAVSLRLSYRFIAKLRIFPW